MPEFAAWLVKHRGQETLRSLAARMRKEGHGVSASTINRWETAATVPDIWALFGVAQVFRKPFPYVLNLVMQELSEGKAPLLDLAAGTRDAIPEATHDEEAGVDLEASRTAVEAAFLERVQRVSDSLSKAHADAINSLLTVFDESGSGATGHEANGSRLRSKPGKSPPRQRKKT